jgi:TrmH family RNA methyltransferase
MVQEAIDSPFTIENIYKKDEIGADAMGRISALSSPSPVLAVLRKPKDSIIDCISQLMPLISKGGLYLALDAIRDPGNLGTIIRLAHWFGISDIVCSEESADCFNPKVVQATMGAILRVRVHYLPLADFLARSAKEGTAIYGTMLDGDNIYSAELKPTGVIVMGNEGKGVSAECARSFTHKLLIPSYPPERQGSESLNVAMATGIVCAEFRRQAMK